jgi:hypothetical protein
VLGQLLDYIRLEPGGWFATHRDAAEYVKSTPEDR